MLSKAHLTSHSRMSGSRWVITPSWLSGSWRSFLYSSSHVDQYERWVGHRIRSSGKNIEELNKKDLHDPDNHDGVIIHLEPDILECKCEVNWALESITTNKASGGDGIPVELFHILKHDAVKVLHSISTNLENPAVGFLDHKAVLFPVFKGISTLFSIVTVLVCILTNSVRGFPFLHTFSSIYCLQTFGLQAFWLASNGTALWSWFAFLW